MNVTGWLLIAQQVILMLVKIFGPHFGFELPDSVATASLTGGTLGARLLHKAPPPAK